MLDSRYDDAQAELTTAVESKRPTAIVAALLGIVRERVEEAIEATLDNRIEDRWSVLNEAIEVICDLRGGVGYDPDDHWSRRTCIVYEDALRLITLANVRNDPLLLSQVLTLLEPMRLAWQTLDAFERPTPAGVQMGADRIPETALIAAD